MASIDSIFIDDIDANQSHPLVENIISPTEVVYLMKENSIYWINTKNELLMYNILTKNRMKIMDISGTPKGLTLDWVERSLYYVEIPKEASGSIIYKVNLNHIDKYITRNVKIFHTSSEITIIEVSPFTKKLYWIETTDRARYKLMQSNIDGEEVQPFFSQRNGNRRRLEGDSSFCNCPLFPEVGPSFTVDHSDAKSKPLLVFIDPYTLNVMSTDQDGCICNVVANNTVINNVFSLNHIKSDIATLYWMNPSQGLLYSFKKRDTNILSKKVEVSDIDIFGQHMQPYPPKECLSPKQSDNFTVSLNYKSANFINLRMPDPIIHENCNNYSMTSIAYTIFYKMFNNDSDCLTAEECGEKITFDRNVELGGLKPYTNYTVSVSISNHFSNTDEILVGLPSIFQTAPGGKYKFK